MLVLPAAGLRHTPAVSRGIQVADWKQIRAEYERHRHGAFPDSRGGYHARSFEQGWLAHFDGRGVSIRPDEESWRWGLELAGVEGKAKVTVDVNRVTYRWKDFDEWYVNDTRGLEHGFTLRAPREIRLTVRGGLRPRPIAAGMEFVDGSGAARMRYTDLEARDADGRLLPSRMQLSGGEVILAVDDRGARYPITIDPLAQQAYVKASNTRAFAHFGEAVSISGDTVVVGASGDSSNATGVNGDQSNTSTPGSGAAYVFVRTGVTWTQQAYLKASTTTAGGLGTSVGISGDTIVAGETGLGGISGGAYVFVRSGTAWSQQALLKGLNTGAIDYYGSAVAISGDTIVVGANRDNTDATGVNGIVGSGVIGSAGAAYIFARSGTTWTQQAYLKASVASENEFGISVSISGDTVVVGADHDDSDATGVNGDPASRHAANSGAAYVYVRNGATWTQQAYLKASNTGASDTFGNSVAISGDTIVAGAPRESSAATGVNGNQADNSALSSGAAYVFARNGTAWTQQAYLKASNTGAGDFLGNSVAISGDSIVVTATGEDSNATGVDGDQSNNSISASGAAYVFTRSGTTWTQQAYLKASNTGPDTFGRSVAISGDTILAGAQFEASNATGINGNQADNSLEEAGAAYIFATAIPESITIASSPSGLSFTTTGTGCAAGSYTTPKTLTWNSGALCAVAFASPQSGPVGTRYALNHWEDSSTNATRSITGPWAAATYTATFDTQYLLTATGGPGGTAGGGGYYTSGASATPTATPDLGNSFASWSGACSGTGSCSVTMDAAKSVTAAFAAPVTITSSPTGRTFTTAGTGCAAGTYNGPDTLPWTVGSSCTMAFATPQSGQMERYVFSQWENSSTSATRSVTAPAAGTTYTASFTTQYQLIATGTPVAGGSVAGAGYYNPGATATPVATPASGYVFTGWSGDCSGTGPCSIVMNQGAIVSATFSPSNSLSVSVAPSSGGTVSGTIGGSAFSCSTTCSTIPTAGASFTLTATAKPGYSFTSWSGCDSTASNTCSLTMNTAKVVRATFTVIPNALTFTATALVLNRTTGRYQQSVTVANSSASAVTNAAFVTDNLPAGVALYGATGTTSAAAPAGSPYVDIGPIAGNGIVTFTLQFTRTATQTITYNGRVLGDVAR
jgi:uncharacterized repeat protein (TIGR02543 family)